MKTVKVLFSVIGLLISTGLFSQTFAAKSWGVTNEEKAKFTGKVVDIACHLNGDCPQNCGQGSRQLGLMTEEKGLILVAKNLTLYTGASYELTGFCGLEVEVDGLFTENKGVRFFQVQNMREVGGKWKKAKVFHKVWADAHGTKPRKAKRWYRKDERIKTIIERDGYLGLGADEDANYFNN